MANPPPLAVPNTPLPPVPSPLVSPSPAPLVRRTHPKLSCSLYIRLAPEQFYDKQKKILWALTFFKGGRATKWFKNVFRQEADTGVFPIQTWGDFKQQFRLHFFPVNVEADAINALEGTSYYQENRMVDDYLDSFQALVSDAGYMDPRTVVVKF